MYVLLKKGLKIFLINFIILIRLRFAHRRNMTKLNALTENATKKKTIAVELWAIRTGILHCNTFLLKWVFAFHLCKKMLEKRIIGRT